MRERDFNREVTIGCLVYGPAAALVSAAHAMTPSSTPSLFGAHWAQEPRCSAFFSDR